MIHATFEQDLIFQVRHCLMYESIKVIISGAIVIHLQTPKTYHCNQDMLWDFLKNKNDLLRDIQFSPPNMQPTIISKSAQPKINSKTKKWSQKLNSSHFIILFFGCMLVFYYIFIHLIFFGIESPTTFLF